MAQVMNPKIVDLGSVQSGLPPALAVRILRRLPQMLVSFRDEQHVVTAEFVRRKMLLDRLNEKRGSRNGPKLLGLRGVDDEPFVGDRKSTRLNSSHVAISYAVFCLKKKTK